MSDNIAFGVAPALIIYLWSLQEFPQYGWIFALTHAVCCALRLARFNAQIDSAEQPHKSAGFLTGRRPAGGSTAGGSAGVPDRASTGGEGAGRSRPAMKMTVQALAQLPAGYSIENYYAPQDNYGRKQLFEALGLTLTKDGTVVVAATGLGRERVRTFRFMGDRALVRAQSVHAALEAVRRLILDL